MRDPYAILGVKRDAGPAEIKDAWRARVKETHPDRNIGDPEAAERFAEVGRAYDVLKDPRRRQLFDMVHKASDARGPTDDAARKRNAAATEAAARAKAADAVMEEIAKAQQQAGKTKTDDAASSTAPEGADDMLERIFGVKSPQGTQGTTEDAQSVADKAAAAGYGPQAIYYLFGLLKRLRGTGSLPEKAPDILAEAMVSAEEILQQKWVTVQLTDGRDIRFQIEAGATDGHVMRIKGQGLKLPDMQRGDVMVKITLSRNSPFQVNGHDIHTSLPIKLEDAVLGCEATVRTPFGDQLLTVPAWSGSDQVIRMEGKGLAKGDGTFGDFVVELRVILLEKPDDKVTDLMRHMREGLYL